MIELKKIRFLVVSKKCDIIEYGRVAEWFKALVLKTSIRKYRKFESCPFRHALRACIKNADSFVATLQSNPASSAKIALLAIF